MNPLGRKLFKVMKPGRYIGGEFGAVNRPWESAKLRWCLVFPEVYEVGLSNLGHQILYYILNSKEGVLADRSYTPWPDMEALLKDEDQKLWGLETGRPLDEFDIIGVTIPYELTYTNIISVLKLGGITPLAKERGEDEPLVIGGGCGAFNPEPVADFFDAIVIGDGEEVVGEISEVLCHCEPTESGRSNPADSTGLLRRFTPRNDILTELGKINGVYIPSLGTKQKIKRAIVPSIDISDYADKLLVPNVDPVHSRVGVEIQRGCSRGCRFCQAGMIYRPDRQKDRETVISFTQKAIRRTGYEECSMLSLSAGDYDGLTGVITELDEKFGEKWVNITLPSLRTESLTPEVVSVLSRSLQGGFTLAPEAATERLRRVINKGNTEEDLLKSAEKIFKTGWKNLKLYFMIGLPGETDEDIEAIPELALKTLNIGRANHRFPNVTVNISTFVPKSHTPFQWEEQISLGKTKEIHEFLKKKIKGPGFKLKLHKPEASFLEGLFSRGGRELSKVILKAHEVGSRFEAWEEHQNIGLWLKIFEECSIDPNKLLAKRSLEGSLPWGHLFAELNKEFLLRERERSSDEELTPDCSKTECAGCGVCDFKNVKPVTYGSMHHSFSEKFLSSSGKRMSSSGKRMSSSGKRMSSSGLTGGSPCFPKDCPIKQGNDIKTESFKYAINFTKSGPMIYIGSIDFLDIWRRTLRRAGLPLKYSKGFNPRPRVSFIGTLPVGVESRDEWAEIELREKISKQEIEKRLKNGFPEGVEISDVAENNDSSRKKAEKNIYRINFGGLSILKTPEEFYASSEILFTKKTKKGLKRLDLKKDVISLEKKSRGVIELQLWEGASASVFDVAAYIFGAGGDARALPIHVVKEKMCLMS